MSEDIIFKFQLGLILPKLREKLGDSLGSIVTELVDIVNAGRVGDDEPVGMDAVKQLIMQDVEIFLDNDILPPIQARLDSAGGESETADTESKVEESETAEA